MVKLVHALDARLHIHVAEKEENVRWLGVYSTKRRQTWTPGHEIEVKKKKSPYLHVYPAEILPPTVELIGLESADSEGWSTFKKDIKCTGF